MNSKNSITSEPLLLVLRFTDRLNLRRGAKAMPYQILEFAMHGNS